MKWKVISSRYIKKDSPWFTARVDEVELPNGEILEHYYVLEYPDWVAVLAITEEGKFVFVEQYRHAHGSTSLELSAGVIDESDTDPLEAARRELQEETGYGEGHWTKFSSICANPGTHTNTTHVYLAVDVKKVADQNLDRTEDINVKLLSKVEVLELLEEDKIVQSLHAAPLWKYFFIQNR